MLEWSDSHAPTHKDAIEYATWFASEATSRRDGNLLSPNTVRQACCAISAWFDFKEKPLDLDRLPCPGPTPPGSLECLQRQDVRATLAKERRPSRPGTVVSTLRCPN